VKALALVRLRTRRDFPVGLIQKLENALRRSGASASPRRAPGTGGLVGDRQWKSPSTSGAPVLASPIRVAATRRFDERAIEMTSIRSPPYPIDKNGR
jgi:hypothetical protein